MSIFIYRYLHLILFEKVYADLEYVYYKYKTGVQQAGALHTDC